MGICGLPQKGQEARYSLQRWYIHPFWVGVQLLGPNRLFTEQEGKAPPCVITSFFSPSLRHSAAPGRPGIAQKSSGALLPSEPALQDASQAGKQEGIGGWRESEPSAWVRSFKGASLLPCFGFCVFSPSSPPKGYFWSFNAFS